ncbi:MAG: TolC family protein [Ferruginibacter sp.]
MDKNFKIYFTAILLLQLSACKISKDIAAPKPPLPEVFRNAVNTDTTNIANIQWKTFFTDASLQQLIDTAIINNFDMQLALKNIDATQLIVKQTKFSYWPDAKLQAGAGISRPSDNSLNGLSLSQVLGKSYIEDYSVSAAVSWEADIWGKIKNQKAKALAAYLQTAEAKKSNTNQYSCRHCKRVL